MGTLYPIFIRIHIIIDNCYRTDPFTVIEGPGYFGHRAGNDIDAGLSLPSFEIAMELTTRLPCSF